MWQQIRDFFASDRWESTTHRLKYGAPHEWQAPKVGDLHVLDQTPRLRFELDKLRADHEDLVARHKYTWSRLVQMSNEVRTRQLVIVDENGRKSITADAPRVHGIDPSLRCWTNDVASGESIQIELLASEDGASLSLFSVHDRSRSAMCVYNYDQPAEFTHHGPEGVSMSFPLEGPEAGPNVVSVLATKGPHPVRSDAAEVKSPGNAPSSTLSEDELSRFLEEIMDTAGSAGIHEDDLVRAGRRFEMTAVHAGLFGMWKRDEVVVRWDEDKKSLHWRLRDP